MRDWIDIYISRLCSILVSAVLFLSGQYCFASGGKTYDDWMNDAQHHMQMLEPEKAIADYTAAIKLSPKSYRPYQLRSEAYRELMNYEKELEDMTRAIACYNVCPLYRDRGYIQFRYGHFKEAVEDYTKALALTPNDHLAFRSRARVYLAMKDYKPAISDFENALKTINSGSMRMEPDLMDNLGKLYIKTKQDQKAIDEYNLLVKKYPNMGRGFYGRAEVYKLQGKADLAKKDLDKAYELDYAMDPTLKKLK